MSKQRKPLWNYTYERDILSGTQLTVNNKISLHHAISISMAWKMAKADLGPLTITYHFLINQFPGLCSLTFTTPDIKSSLNGFVISLGDPCTCLLLYIFNCISFLADDKTHGVCRNSYKLTGFFLPVPSEVFICGPTISTKHQYEAREDKSLIKNWIIG